ncbi:Metallo-dependent phosphatase-like protein [Polychytrium aggregatum]|uniref:Metallo-dependent phosphatase-like protein n=1 Tax=Polychytrium aggregatum TaxID=110093 RepID=UPI0022FEA32F|nr:Metallo-dependent phosphatase-like protein [Polychytrium aggregatum]KAI9203805.1 Metallo-dependent phosphatase-like protein [Polychytrium aggregatum]
MRIAIEGCCHGELDNIYEALVHLQNVNSCKIDLLIICGDFQSIRNLADLDVIACPDKYKSMGTFYRYYNGEKVAPIPTIFIGGNHEASNYLWELYHGGWVCPNIYFLGFGGVVNFGGLRIGGLTGIYNPAHYDKGFFETQPFSNKSCRSIYHVRKYNVYRMAQIRQPLHCFVSHDWPNGIAAYGNVRRLLKLKPYFADEVRTGTLGSDANQFLLKRLKPSYWFSAHLHVKFAAVYPHEPEHPVTRFLALDKCLPRRDFIQVMDIPEVEGSGPYELHYDEEWLAIMRATHEYMSLAYNQKSLPDDATIRA